MNVSEALIHACQVWLAADRAILDGRDPIDVDTILEADALVDHAVNDYLSDESFEIVQIREDRPNNRRTGIVRIVLGDSIVIEVDANKTPK